MTIREFQDICSIGAVARLRGCSSLILATFLSLDNSEFRAIDTTCANGHLNILVELSKLPDFTAHLFASDYFAVRQSAIAGHKNILLWVFSTYQLPDETKASILEDFLSHGGILE